MKQYALIFLLIVCLVFTAGCVGDESEDEPIVIQPEIKEVESPVMNMPETPGATFTLTAVKSPDPGNIELQLIGSSTNELRRDGYDIRYTFFIYNTDAVEPGWYPKTYEDVINSGIVYTTKRDKIFQNNGVVINIVLPRESSIKKFDADKPYVYGVIGTDVSI